MWRSLLEGSEWSELLDVVAPSFFDVLPPRLAAGQVSSLLGSLAGGSRHAALKESIGGRLGESDWPVLLDESASKAQWDSQASSRLGTSQRWVREDEGQLLLRLYFLQLLDCREAFLDLRQKRFTWVEGMLTWNPGRLLVSWDLDFLAAVRSLYRGFYMGDTPTLRAALRELSVDVAEDLFLRHFGDKDQSRLTFSLAAFRRDFHDVFVRCRDHGRVLHPNVIPFGVLLAFLYEHLEHMGVPQDARQAFFAAQQLSSLERR